VSVSPAVNVIMWVFFVWLYSPNAASSASSACGLLGVVGVCEAVEDCRALF